MRFEQTDVSPPLSLNLHFFFCTDTRIYCQSPREWENPRCGLREKGEQNSVERSSVKGACVHAESGLGVILKSGGRAPGIYAFLERGTLVEHVPLNQSQRGMAPHHFTRGKRPAPKYADEWCNRWSGASDVYDRV
ncbi:hypothetical protein KM043_007125 [Ampulex compressa]|nr:hypothetical protein KM043_007125 [Ampulex compressa]